MNFLKPMKNNPLTDKLHEIHELFFNVSEHLQWIVPSFLTIYSEDPYSGSISTKYSQTISRNIKKQKP